MKLFKLADGEITDNDWDCDGVYLPTGTVSLSEYRYFMQNTKKISAEPSLAEAVNPEQVQPIDQDSFKIVVVLKKN